LDTILRDVFSSSSSPWCTFEMMAVKLKRKKKKKVVVGGKELTVSRLPL